MTDNSPIHHSTVEKRTPEHEVRHLLILRVDGSHRTELIQFDNGKEKLVATGTEYESREKADALLEVWTTQEGFTFSKEGYAFEPLERTIALARKMGYKAIYDDRYKSTRPPFNLTGAVLLKEWPGLTPNNGGSYVYALDQMRLYARPQLPQNGERLVAPSGAEFAAFMLKHKAMLDAVGPSGNFVLAD